MLQKMFADSLVQGERVGSGRDADPADDDPNLDPDSCYFFFRYKSKCKWYRCFITTLGNKYLEKSSILEGLEIWMINPDPTFS